MSRRICIISQYYEWILIHYQPAWNMSRKIVKYCDWKINRY